jgi:hypothetical protein
MKSSERAYDDLTVIAGIKQARQRWLREVLGVHTYQDLATLSASQIQSRLKADGQIVSRSAIEGWLIKAKELASSTGSSAVPTLQSTGQAANSPGSEQGWKPFASFVVEFQAREVEGQAYERRTAVHYMEQDVGADWPGIESSRLCHWMVDQIGGEAGLAEVASAEAPRARGPSSKIAIRRVRIHQLAQAEAPAHEISPGERFLDSVRAGQPFWLEVESEITCLPPGGVAAEQIECLACGYAYDEARKTTLPLGENGPRALQRGKHVYTFALPEATLPTGKYRLVLSLTPQDSALVIPDYIEVPNFTVA